MLGLFENLPRVVDGLFVPEVTCVCFTNMEEKVFAEITTLLVEKKFKDNILIDLSEIFVDDGLCREVVYRKYWLDFHLHSYKKPMVTHFL